MAASFPMSGPDAKAFIIAGDATVTLKSLKTEQHYTYRVQQAKRRETGERQQLWFVSLLTAPDQYTYIGIIKDGAFGTTAKSKLTMDSKPCRALVYVLSYLQHDKIAPHVEIRHDGRCGRCHRELTVPESIDSGLGPDCRAQMGLGNVTAMKKAVDKHCLVK